MDPSTCSKALTFELNFGTVHQRIGNVNYWVSRSFHSLIIWELVLRTANTSCTFTSATMLENSNQSKTTSTYRGDQRMSVRLFVVIVFVVDAGAAQCLLHWGNLNVMGKKENADSRAFIKNLCDLNAKK